MTEKQMNKNKEDLIKLFDILIKTKPEQLKEMLKDEYDKKQRWYYQNIYYRYKLREDDPTYYKSMKKDFANIIEEIIEQYGLTKEQFLNTKGNIEKLMIELQRTNKKENLYSDKTTTELNKMKEDLIEKKINLKRALTPRGMSLYNEEKINEIKSQIDEYEQRIKQISEELKTRNDSTEQAPIQIIQEVNVDKTYEKKFNDMKESYDTTIKEKEQQINDREDTIQKLQKENATLQRKIRENISDLEEQKRILLKHQSQIRKELKEKLITLLLNNKSISYSYVKQALEIDNDTYKSLMCEIKDEIPGIIEQITNDGYCNRYTLANKAWYARNQYIDQKPEIQMCNINIPNKKTLKFIVRTDTHIDMASEYDEIMRELNPYHELSALYGNAPIIDLGDIADTYEYFDYKEMYNPDTKKADVKALKLAYEFYKNYGKTLAQIPQTKHYTILGNHDIDPFYAGVDPIKVIRNYSPNFRYAGLISGSVKIKNLDVGLYHGILPENEIKTSNSYTYDTYEFLERIDRLSKKHGLILVGHYHLKKIYSNANTVLVDNGTKTATVLTVTIENNCIESICLELYTLSEQNKFINYNEGYPIMIYNRPKYYQK